MIHAGLFKQKGNLYASFGMNQLPTAAMGYAITDNLGLAANLHGERLGELTTKITTIQVS